MLKIKINPEKDETYKRKGWNRGFSGKIPDLPGIGFYLTGKGGRLSEEKNKFPISLGSRNPYAATTVGERVPLRGILLCYFSLFECPW